MNIINIGGWYVGNSAVLDWMDGFEELAVVKGDLNIARLENGVMDMISEKSFAKKSLMVSLQKRNCYRSFFLMTRALLGKYTKHVFKSNTPINYVEKIKFHSIFLRTLLAYEKKIATGEDFDEIKLWKSWLLKLPLVSSKDKNYKHIVYQNPFFYDENFSGHQDVWPKLFSPHKMMFVHRDPLDQFSDIVKAGEHLNVSWLRFHGGTEELHPADRFFEISKKIYSARLRMAETISQDKLIIFSFEDFLTKHDEASESIKNFLELKERDYLGSRRFNLKESMRNIGNGHLHEETNNLLKERGYIMDELYSLRDKLIEHPNAIF